MKILISIFALIIMTESCKSADQNLSSKSAEVTNSKSQEMLSGKYHIIQFGDRKSLKEKLLINFDSETNSVSGFSGCNSFSGSYSTNNDLIEISNLFSSKKFCPGSKSDIENEFLNILKKATTFSIEGDVLSFIEDDTLLIKASKTLSPKMSKSDVVKNSYNTNTVTYQATSRGMFEYISISESEIQVSSDRNLLNINHYPISDVDWKKVSELMNTIDRNLFTKLKAPTDKRLFDGAAHATLVIIQGDVLVTTPAFDHGHPPTEIETLVNKVLSIKESTTKQ